MVCMENSNPWESCTWHESSIFCQENENPVVAPRPFLISLRSGFGKSCLLTQNAPERRDVKCTQKVPSSVKFHFAIAR